MAITCLSPGPSNFLSPSLQIRLILFSITFRLDHQFKHFQQIIYSQINNMAPATSKTATPKTAVPTAGVKKVGRPSKAGKKGNARNAMIKMQAYCKFKAH
jgi:hypothetical protein